MRVEHKIHPINERRDLLARMDAEYLKLRREVETGEVKSLMIIGLRNDNTTGSALLSSTAHAIVSLINATLQALNNAHLELHPECKACAEQLRDAVKDWSGASAKPMNPKDLN